MHRRKLLLMLSALMVGIIAIAAPRTAEQARKIAAEQARKLGIASAQPQLMEKASPRRAAGIGTTDANYYYVFNNEGGKGFTIVSGDDLMPEIVGYSDQGSFSEENMPENVKSFLKAYEQTLDKVAEGDAKSLQIVDELKAHRAESTDVYTVGDILLGNIMWDQGEPYNFLCPTYTDANGEEQSCATGCCATAVAQIMRYHKWPKELTVDIPDYTTNIMGQEKQWEGVKVEPEGHTYDWDNMLESYSYIEGTPSYTFEQALAVARLMNDVGRSVKMEYGPESAAYSNAPFTALTEYFGYDPDLIQLILRETVSLEQWTEILKKDINEKRPVYYFGNSDGGGHMFVCDGYDSNDFFHINWGWGGYCNGFFDITILNPNSNSGIGASSTADGFDMLNIIIVGIQPDNGIVDEPLWDLPILYVEKTDNHQITNSKRQNQTQKFTLSPGLQIANWSTKTFNGEIGFANIDNEGNMTIIDKTEAELKPNQYFCDFKLDYAFPVGKNTVVVVEKPTGSTEWRLVNCASSCAITLIATETELAFAEPEHLSLNVLSEEITAGSGEVEVEITNNTNSDYYGRVHVFVTDTKEEYEENADKLKPVNVIPLGLDKGQSVKRSIELTTTDVNKEFWLTFRDDKGNIVGGSAIKTVANSEPTFVITGYSIDGEEITQESEVSSVSLWNGEHDIALAHNAESPTIAIHVKNLGADGTFSAMLYNEYGNLGYPSWEKDKSFTLDIPLGETRDMVWNSSTVGEGLCLWTLEETSSPFIIGNVPFAQTYNNGTLVLFYAYNEGQSTGISMPTMDFEITDKIYNLRGQRVKSPTEKGIYIIGKKKVLVK